MSGIDPLFADDDPPVEVLERKRIEVSRWLSLAEVSIVAPGRGRTEVYHGIAQADAVTALAMTPDGRFPIVRQYRPIAGIWTWELPAGAIDADETPEAALRREVLEETGHAVVDLVPLGAPYEDPPRRTNRVSLYFAIVEPRRDTVEAGIRLHLATGGELARLASGGRLGLPVQVALLYLAAMSPEVTARLAALGFDRPPWFGSTAPTA